PGASLRLSVDDARRRLRLLALIPEQLRAGGDAAAERRPLLAGDVLLAHRAARHLRRVGLAGRELRHRGHALAERCALLAGHVLLALVLAVAAVGLRLRRERGVRRRPLRVSDRRYEGAGGGEAGDGELRRAAH